MNELIKQLQAFMKTAPAGISYNGPVNGKSNEELKSATNNLQNLIRKTLNDHSDKNIADKAKSFIIMSGDNVISSISDIKYLISEINKSKETKIIDISNKNIEAIQKVFNSNPLGIKYSGPTDGIPNQELVEKSRLLEKSISDLTGASILGKITDGKTIITTATDLQKTFNIIQEYQKFLKK